MKNKQKFNVMDWLIVIGILMVIVVGIYVLSTYGKLSSKSTANVNVEYTIELLDRERELADMFMNAVGTTVSVGEKESAEAVITNVKVEATRKQTTDMVNGKIIMAEKPGLYDVLVTLQSEATETDKDIQLNGSPILVGTETSVKGKGFAGYGFIVDMDIVKE